MNDISMVHNCKNCIWGNDTCHHQYGVKNCGYFSPTDESEYSETVLEYLKEKNIPSTESKLKRHPFVSRCATDDGTDSLDVYYVRLINDVLKNIRHGELDYVFNIDQLAELLRFEPNLNAVYIKGSWEVWLDCYR